MYFGAGGRTDLPLSSSSELVLRPTVPLFRQFHKGTTLRILSIYLSIDLGLSRFGLADSTHICKPDRANVRQTVLASLRV